MTVLAHASFAHYFVTPGNQAFCEVVTDESGDAGYKDFHTY